MKIIIYQNREVYKEESKIGNDSENKVETLEFEFPEEYADFTKYIEFQIKGEKYVDLVEGNKYVITREVAKYGKIKTQLVLKKNIENDVLIFKSNVFELNVSKSINASENLVSTVGIDLIEKIVTKNSEQDYRLNTLEADNTTNKENILNLQNDNTTNKTNIKSLQDDNEVNKTDISNIKQEQTVQNTNIQELQTDNTSNKSKIVNLEMKNAEQNNKIVSLETKNTQQDTSIQTNTESIAQLKEKDTTQDSLIEELQAENTKLKKEINSMQIPGEATGNPIHLSDSSDMECEIVPIGNAEQETREGYNLLDLSGFTSVDKNGIVATKNEDGSIKLNGTSTAGLGIYIPINKTLSSGSYKHSIGTVIPEEVYISLDNTSNTLISNSTGSKKNFEITEETSYTNYLIWINANVTLSNLTIYPMLYQGTEDKPYEPYGAMPSPDYPSEIVTVGSNINLLENKAITQTINGVTFTVSKDGCVMVNGTATTNTTFKINDDIVPKNISNLILSGCPNNGSKSTYDLKIELYKNGVWTKVLYDFGNGVDTGDLSEYTSCTISTTIRKDYNANNLVFKPKLEKGTKATAYSPYNQGSVEIDVVNKNLAKINETNWELTENNTIKNKARNQGIILTEMNMKANIKYKIHLKLFSKPTTASTFTCFLNDIAQSAKKAFVNINNFTLNTTYTIEFLLEEDMKFKMNFSGNTNSEIFEFQLWAEIDEATDYIPHKSYTKVLPIQKEFVKIGDVEDTFVKVEGKWYEQHTIEKLILDGSESWIYYNSGTFGVFYSDVVTGKVNNSNYLCTHFIKGSYTINNNVIQFNGNGRLHIRNDNISNATDFKSWLAEQYANGTPVIVYYVLAIPELIECTAEQEEILNSFYTYKNITNISVDGIATLKVNYKKDLETLINNLSATSVAE